MNQVRRWSLLAWASVVGCTEAARQVPDPPDEPKLVTRQDAEPAGTNCRLGGTAVRAGLDRNGSGALDDAEVEHTDYICDVATTLLVRRTLSLPTLECPQGGEVLQTGIDDNANGLLEDGEIDETTRVCSSLEVWARDFTRDDWNDPIKVAALRGARVVLGSLAIEVIDDVELPQLELVTESLILDTATAAIAFPALRSVGGALVVGTGSSVPDLPVLQFVGANMHVGPRTEPLVLPQLSRIVGNLVFSPGAASVTFSALHEVNGELFVSGDSSLLVATNLHTIDGPLNTWIDTHGTLSLPGLRTLGGELHLIGPITALQLDRLESIGGGIRFNHPRVVDFDLVLPSVQSIVGDVDAVGEDGLATIEMPQLTELRGELHLSSAPALTKISLPAIRRITGSIRIFGADVLAAVDLHSLVSVDGGVVIVNAPMLTTLLVGSLNDIGRIESLSTSFQLSQTAVEIVDLASLRVAADFLSLGGNPQLRTVRLPELVAARGIGVGGDSSVIETLTAPKITTLTTLNVVGPIHTLDLGQLTDVTGLLAIDGATLPNLDGLSKLTRVGTFLVMRCNALSDFRSLSRLRTLSTLWLTDNGGLLSLDGLERVTEISRFFRLENNDALTSVAGLGNVAHIGQLMFMQSNDALTTIELTHLSSIGGDFSSGGLFIADMLALDTLSGLDALVTVGGDIEIQRNDRLSAEEVHAFIQRILDNR